MTDPDRTMAEAHPTHWMPMPEPPAAARSLTRWTRLDHVPPRVGSRSPNAQSGHRSPLDLVLADCGRLPWFVVRFEPNAQGIALPALHRIGVSTFLPLIRIAIQDKRLGRRITTVPAFPGCLFAQWRAGFLWQRILCNQASSADPQASCAPSAIPHGQPQRVPDGYMDDFFAGRAMAA